MKRFLSIIVMVMLMTITLYGCTSGGSGDADKKEESSGTEKSHKVALILPGSITDKSWNYTSYEGLKEIEKEGAEISYQEKVDVSQVEDSIRTYAGSGYDLIYIGSNIFEEQVLAVAPDFPETTFIIISGNTISDNVYSFRMSDAQQGFLMGVAAGVATKKNSVGFVGSRKITPILNAEKGFAYGVSYVNPDCQVNSVLTGSSSDTAAAKEVAKAMIDSGADIIGTIANAASSGPIEAAQESDVACVAPGEGYENIAPSTLMVAAIMDNGVPVYNSYKQYISDSLPKEVYEYTAKDGVLYLSDWTNSGKAGDDVKNKVESVYKELADGKISIPLD